MNKILDAKGVLNRYIISKDKKGYNFILITLNDELYSKIISDADSVRSDHDNIRFKENYGFRVGDIIIYGDPDIGKNWKNLNNSDYNSYMEDMEAILKSILPEPTFVKFEDTGIVGNAYKCWCGAKLNVDDYAKHKTATESWKCLITKIGNPKNCFVIKTKTT